MFDLFRFFLFDLYLACFVALSIIRELKWKKKEIGLESCNYEKVVTIWLTDRNGVECHKGG